MLHDSDSPDRQSPDATSVSPVTDPVSVCKGSDLAEFLATLPEACFVLDQDWRFTHINLLAEKLLGQLCIGASGPLLGRSIVAECPEIADSTFCKECRQAVAESRVVEIETYYPALNRWFNVVLYPTMNHLCVFLRDTNQRARLERELRQRLEELAEAERGKDAFLVQLAHEIRDVFAPIRNALHLVSGQDLGRDAARACALAEQGIRRLRILVDDLVMVSQFALALPQKQRLNLSTVIAETLAEMLALEGEGGRTFAVQLPPQALWLDADLKQLKQIVGHVLDNAVRSTSQNGSIRLTAAREGAEVVLCVRDDGIGLRPEVLAQEFNPFSFQDSGPGCFQWGQGVALMLVRRLVELHGGSVEVTNCRTNQGSQISIRLPAHEEPHSEVVGPSPAIADDRRLRVLVVDDCMESAQSLSLLLGTWGCNVRLAYEGAEALDTVRAWPPDLVLLDLAMPGMDGYQVATRIRQEAGERLPLVALTGYDHHEARARAREAGFDYHMVKLVDPADMKNLIRYFQSGAQRIATPGN
jgi:signal transduction histidine kinase/ActR/RegA family two-component response regulator